MFQWRFLCFDAFRCVSLFGWPRCMLRLRNLKIIKLAGFSILKHGRNSDLEWMTQSDKKGKETGTEWNTMKQYETQWKPQNQSKSDTNKKYKINIKESKRYKKKWKRYIDLSARSFSSFRKPYWRSFLVEVSAYFKHLGASQACSWM